MAKTRALGHIGGLAVALGIGAAVATGFAAQASADASPEGAASAGRGAVAVKNVSRPASSHSAKRSVAAARRPAPAAASAVTRNPRGPLRSVAAPTLSAPLQPAPLTTPVTTPVASTAAAQITPSDIWSSLMTRLAGIFGWDPRGRLQTVYKGTHFTIPNNFGFFIQKVSGSATFTPNTTYDLGDSDQYDWNKLTGIAFTPLEPDRDSAMVGWRYNLVDQVFEIAPFYNVNKVRILPNENPLSPGYEVIQVPADQTFTYTVDYTGVTISYGGRTVFKPYPEGLTPNVWTAARVSGWFGGNEAAPRTVSYYLKLD